MAEATPLPRASEISYFTDSAVNVETITPAISPRPKPPFETGDTLAVVSVVDHAGEQPERLACLAESSSHKHPNREIETVHDHSDMTMTELITSSSENVSLRESTPEADLELECLSEHGVEVVSHLSTTVSSLRLRHQEQSHLQSLFTSKLEALAQRSLQHEATVRSLAAELRSLRGSNTTLGRENALLEQENNDLRLAMQNLRTEITEREMAMEAMTGAVRGLEGWIESANNSPQRISHGSPQQDKRQSIRERKDVIRGKGRFRGRYSINGGGRTGINGGLSMDALNDVNTVEIQEGIMAWVRGFKDVEEGLKARSEGDGSVRETKQATGRPPAHQNNDTIDTFDEEFGDFETVG